MAQDLIASGGAAAAPIRRVVLMDADPDHGMALLQRLADHGFRVVITHDLYGALTIIGRDRPELAIFQHDGVNGDSDRAMALARMLYPETQVIQTTDDPAIISGAATDERLLSRPVTYDALDCCLAEMHLARRH